MNRTLPLAGTLALLIASGCSALQQPALVGSPSGSARVFALRHGMPPSKAIRSTPLHDRSVAQRRLPKSGTERGLYVAEPIIGYYGQIDIFKNKSWEMLGTLTNGLNGPHGEWFDKNGKLLVTNVFGGTVVEFQPGKQEPSVTYTDGLVDPVTVTADSSGSVYIADYNLQQDGFLDVYADGKDKLVRQCALAGSPTGVAVDKTGTVYVAYLKSGQSSGDIEEFPQGSCDGQTLGLSTGWPGSLAIDKHANLVLADQTGPAVDVIAPPYTAVTKQLTNGFVPSDSDPIAVALNRKQNRLYIADPRNSGAGYVVVLKYPSGKLVTTLNSSNGIRYPLGIADFPGAI